MPEKEPEVADAAHYIDLFKNVVIAQDDEGVRFSVPERILRSEKFGSFALNVYGEVEYFKEHDHYGQIRTLQRDGGIMCAVWAPHLFPFEEVDPVTHLPDILDRERCSFVATLHREQEGEQSAPHPYELAIHSPRGIFAAIPDMGQSYSGHDVFNEFHWYLHRAVGQHVEWPDETPPSTADFLADLMVSDPDRFNRIMQGEETMPAEFEKAHEPLDYRTRESWANESGLQAFGAIWVPVDELRRGIEAEVEFPMFQR
jgi:hypothetical protein